MRNQKLRKGDNSGASLIAQIRECVKLANKIFSRRDDIAVKRNKFQSNHHWKKKNPFDKPLDQEADALSKHITKISVLSEKLKAHKDWELYSALYFSIMNKQFILTNHMQYVNKDQVQHKSGRRKANLASTKRRTARNSSGRN